MRFRVLLGGWHSRLRRRRVQSAESPDANPGCGAKRR